MDLRQLRFIVATADAGGFRGAARQLGMSYPPISQAVRALEAELGVQLVHSTSQGVLLTSEGEELARRARVILRDVDEARAAIRAAAEPAQSLRLGMVSGLIAAGEMTAPIIQTFRNGHPHVQLSLHELDLYPRRALLDEIVDVALVHLPIDETGLEVIPLGRESLVLLVATDGPLAGAPELSIDDFADERTVPLDAPPDYAAFWQLDAERGRPNPHPRLPDAPDVAGIQWAVAARHAVLGVIHSLPEIAPNPLIQAIPLRGVTPSTCAVARRRGDRRSTVAAFMDQAVATAQRHIAAHPDGVVAAVA